VWTVEGWHGQAWAKPKYDKLDPASPGEQRVRQSVFPIIRCRTPSHPGIAFDVLAVETCERLVGSDGSSTRSQWELTDIDAITVRRDEARNQRDLFASVGASSLPDILRQELRRRSRKTSGFFSPRARGVPTPGQAGHPDQYYVEWAEVMAAAMKHYGRGYMKRLMTEQAVSRSEVYRRKDVAVERGLCRFVSGPDGKRTIELTDRGREVRKHAQGEA